MQPRGELAVILQPSGRLAAPVWAFLVAFWKFVPLKGRKTSAFLPFFFCLMGVFLPFPDFCSLFPVSYGLRNRRKREQKRSISPKTPNLPSHSSESHWNSSSAREQNSQNFSKTPNRQNAGGNVDICWSQPGVYRRIADKVAAATHKFDGCGRKFTGWKPGD